jgi:UDP-N-acetylglucosamine 2-epimerase (non-hydrolysing)
VPMLGIRNVTERPETLMIGKNRLVGTDRAPIVEAARTILAQKQEPGGNGRFTNPYGDGRASRRIRKALERFHENQYPLLESDMSFQPRSTIP